MICSQCRIFPEILWILLYTTSCPLCYLLSHLEHICGLLWAHSTHYQSSGGLQIVAHVLHMCTCTIYTHTLYIYTWIHRNTTHTLDELQLSPSCFSLPVLVVSTEGLSFSAEPLTNKHLGAFAQIITDWKELGLQLQISSDDLDHISRTHRTNSERCSKMFWLANVEEHRQLLAETVWA